MFLRKRVFHHESVANNAWQRSGPAQHSHRRSVLAVYHNNRQPEGRDLTAQSFTGDNLS